MAQYAEPTAPGVNETLVEVTTDIVAGEETQVMRLDMGAGASPKRLVGGQQTKADSLPVVFASDQDMLSVMEAGPENPQRSYASDAAIAPGFQGTLDSDAIASGQTGVLTEVFIVASVALKIELHTMQNGVSVGDKIVTMTPPCVPWHWEPKKGFFAIAHDPGVGFDGFRAIVTNLDPVRAADAHGSFLFDMI